MHDRIIERSSGKNHVNKEIQFKKKVTNPRKKFVQSTKNNYEVDNHKKMDTTVKNNIQMIIDSAETLI